MPAQKPTPVAIYFLIVREIRDGFVSQPYPNATELQRRRRFSAVCWGLSIASETPHEQGTGFKSSLSLVHPSLLPRVGGLHFTRRHAAWSERSPERRGPRPASEAGKPKLTKAPRSLDRGCGNFGRVPLQSAVVGVSREARKREAACLRAPSDGPDNLHCRLGRNPPDRGFPSFAVFPDNLITSHWNEVRGSRNG